MSQRDIKYVGDEGSDVTAFRRTTEDLVVHHDPHPEFTESVPEDDESEDEWDKLLHDAGKTLEEKISECRYDESHVYVRCSDPSCQKWRRIENVVYYALQKESDLTIDEWTCAEMGYRHAAAGRPPPVTAHKGVPAGVVALYTQVFDVPLSSQDDTYGTNGVITKGDSQGSVSDAGECAVFLTCAARKGEASRPTSRGRRNSPTSKITEFGIQSQLVGQPYLPMQRFFRC